MQLEGTASNEAYYENLRKMLYRAERQRDKLAEALRGMLDNYIELKRITLAVARSDSPNWLGCQMTPEDDIHVKAARAALTDLDK